MVNWFVSSLSIENLSGNELASIRCLHVIEKNKITIKIRLHVGGRLYNLLISGWRERQKLLHLRAKKYLLRWYQIRRR